MPDLVMKQVVAVIDGRTTTVCLHAAGQIRPLDEPFETLLGEQEETPFHLHCRSMVVPWMPGFVNEYRRAANAELLRRPKKDRRIGPNGETGPLPPRAPDNPPLPPTAHASEVRLGRELREHGNVPIREVPEKYRKAYIEAHPDRFEMTSNGGGISETYWVTDRLTGDRYVLKAGQYHNESVAEVIGTRLQHELGFKSEVLVVSDMTGGNGWVLLKHAEDVADHKAAGFKVVGTGGSHGNIAKLGPRLENPPEAMAKLLTDFVIDEADAKGGNLLLISRDGGKTVRLAPIDRSLSQMGWRDAVEPGKTSVVTGDWSLAGRLKVSTLREYMKTRGSPKGVLDLVRDLADDGWADELVQVYDETLATLRRLDLADLTRGLPDDLVAENVALIRRRIDLLESKREAFLKEMGIVAAKTDVPPAPVVADTWSQARLRGNRWLQDDTVERAVPGGGTVGGPRWIGDRLGDTLTEFRESAPDWGEVYDRAAATLGTLADEFPDAMAKVSFVRMSQNPGKSAFAWYDQVNGSITVNLSQMGDLADLQKRYDAARAVGWFADADGTDAVMGVIAHEVGHHLDFVLKSLGTAKNDPWPTMWRRIGEEMRKVDGKVKSGTAARKPENLKRYGKDLVSEYGGKSEHEFIAEAFTEFMTSPDPRPVARIVGEAFYDAFEGKTPGAASSLPQAGRLRRGPDVERTVKEVAQEPPPVVAAKAGEALLDEAKFPLPARDPDEKPLRYAFRAVDQARKNREAYAASGETEAVIANLAERWTGSGKAATDGVRREVLSGQAPEVLSALRTGPAAPTLYRGMSGSNDEFVEMVRSLGVGSDVDLRGVSSFTENRQWADTFVGDADLGTSVILEVRDARGLPVNRISNTPGEDEWLLTGRLQVTRVVEERETTGGGTFKRVEATWLPE